ncbi:glycoside hydrolase family 25 protein [Pontibacter actiniarum]|uniref:Lysozyme n=1 Tax=Pontibacter actiniarum TaxID=323450 RepID=A0A1X9YW82_9BACT|nr:GH25 family lysozyme [Pontibacter actiniarum]ARS37092.1 lysozyme [Pontibacter actiniarum]
MPFTLLSLTLQKLAFSGLLLYSSLVGVAPTGTSATTDNNDPKAATAANNNAAAVVKGIDVSRWQKEVDWSLVRESEVSFAFVKATQGDFRLDPYFARNWEETKRHGIKRGAYHFYKPEAPVKDQIKLFTSTVTLEAGDLPPVLDIEVSDPKVSSENLRRDIREWLEGVTVHYGVRPIIYTSQNYYRRYLQGHFPEYHFWIARYSAVKPEIHHTDSWMFWQYTDRGSISGINSAVDINFFAGDFEQLSSLCLPQLTSYSDLGSPLKQLKHLQPLP